VTLTLPSDRQTVMTRIFHYAHHSVPFYGGPRRGAPDRDERRCFPELGRNAENLRAMGDSEIHFSASDRADKNPIDTSVYAADRRLRNGTFTE
jgi:hypothetical protein